MSKNEKKGKTSFVTWLIFIVVAIIIFFIGRFTSTIVERKTETTSRLQIVKELPEYEPRNEIWGENFPKEYESYRKTLDTNFSSKHGGSAMIDYLEEFPNLVILWAGYGFSKDYSQGRGHAYAVNDIRMTLRTGGVQKSPMPATCWSCKSTDVPRLMNEIGYEAFYRGKWIEKGDEIINPIGCQDCHDPKTMNLRITRPALIEAFERQGKNIEDFSHQEMRSLVCAQCHVEYYFKGDGTYLTFPWDKGFSADSMEAYYDEFYFKDWVHKQSKTPMLKAQHPDYELYMTGIHAARGVSCADCHMPYKVEGGVKYTDHHIQSPLNNMANSCQVCHRESEEQLKKDVYARQDRIMEIRAIAEDAIAKAHMEAKIAWDNGASDEEMAPVQAQIRSAQWRWDWVAAANSAGFHSPVEALRVLGTSIQRAEKARGLLSVIFTKHNVVIPVELPDVSTKELAQKYVGLDMEALRKDKDSLIKTVFPVWDQKAKERQGTLIKY